jgi:hypothetical protein
MNLTRWNNLSDRFDYEELSNNFLHIDQHDHSSGKGVPVTGIAANAVGNTEIANAAVTASKLGEEAVTSEKIQNNAVTSEKIEDGSITKDKLSLTVRAGCELVTSSDQSFSNNVSSKFAFTTANYNIDEMFSTSAPTQIVVSTPGIYALTLNGFFDRSSSGRRLVGIYKNFEEFNFNLPISQADFSPYGAFSVSAIALLNDGDYLEGFGLQTSGSSLSTRNVRFAAQFLDDPPSLT